MKLAIIGAEGVVGCALVEHFSSLGHEVLSVDRNTEATLAGAVPQADVIFVVTLPIEEVAVLLAQTASWMRPGTLLIHGTSIQNPTGQRIEVDQILARQITFCHFHFHFRPQSPLSRTLLGQRVSISIQESDGAKWREWVLKQFAPFHPIIDEFAFGTEHDRVTSASQLVHMVIALLVAGIWRTLPEKIIRKAIEIGGPPCQLLLRSVLRVGTGARVTESILYNHPLTLKMVDNMFAVLQDLRLAILAREPGALVGRLLGARNIIEPTILHQFDKTTVQLARAEADARAAEFEFRFPPAANRSGLLVRILQEFRGLDLTTTQAQTDPDGGCTIKISVRELSDAARAAEQVVRNWAC